MTYSEFEEALLKKLIELADADERGTCEAFEAAKAISPHVKREWVIDAVKSRKRSFDALV